MIIDEGIRRLLEPKNPLIKTKTGEVLKIKAKKMNLDLNREITHEELLQAFEVSIASIALFVLGVFATFSSALTAQAYF